MSRPCRLCGVALPASANYRTRYHAACLEVKAAAKRRAAYASDPCHYHGQMLKSVYGITLETYNRMLEEQDGVCALCGRDNGSRRLCVDHDHSFEPGDPASVRGLLCGICNKRLHALENKGWEARARAYLDAHRDGYRPGVEV